MSSKYCLLENGACKIPCQFWPMGGVPIQIATYYTSSTLSLRLITWIINKHIILLPLWTPSSMSGFVKAAPGSLQWNVQRCKRATVAW